MRKIKRIIAVVLMLVLTTLPFINVNAAKVRLNKKTATITVGKTIKLKLKNSVGKIKWSSSNKKIATVSKKGLVKGKKAGKAKITAKIGTKKYTCTIKVKNKKKKVQTPIESPIESPIATQKPVAIPTQKPVVTAQPTQSTATIVPPVTESTLPDIKITPISVVYEQPMYTKYYSMKILVENNTDNTIYFNNEVMLYFPYMSSNSDVLLLMTDASSNSVSITDPIIIEPYSSGYIYGFEGKTLTRITSYGTLGLFMTIDGIEYSVLCDSNGDIISFEEYVE